MAAPEKDPLIGEEHEATRPITIRAFEERTRGLSLDAQMVECIDLLQTPSVVVEDLVRSVFEIAESGNATPTRGRLELAFDQGVTDSDFFYPSRELFVQGDGCSFTCLATAVDFLDEPVATGASEDENVWGSIDYAAVTCESRLFPVLGFTQRRVSESAYPLLLRSLASLVELGRPRRLDALDRQIYRGLLGPAPVFDLDLVLWDDDQEPDARRPLCEFSRDLAEVLKNTLQSEPRFPPILRDIVCLRMNNKRFDGRLRFVWRV